MKLIGIVSSGLYISNTRVINDLSGLNSSVAFAAVTYRTSKKMLYSGSIPPVGMTFFLIISLYKHPFLFIFKQDCAFCILLRSCFFNVRLLFKLKTFLKKNTELKAINRNYTLV